MGSWRSEWHHKKGKGQLNELTVLAVDAEGRITAEYCFQRPDGVVSFFHVNPGGIEIVDQGRMC